MISSGEPRGVRKTLEAFSTLFTQPTKQQALPTSLRAATTAIGLCSLPGFGLLRGVHSAGWISFASLLVVLFWMLVTSIIARPENKELAMARNLSLVSFWIPATLVLVFCAELFFSDPLQKGIRFQGVAGLLFLLILIHLCQCVRFQCVRFWSVLWLMPTLWTTMALLAYLIVYEF